MACNCIDLSPGSNLRADREGRCVSVEKMTEQVYEGLTKLIDSQLFNLQTEHILWDARTLVGSFSQVRWERDIAIEQLRELGYEFGEKIT